MSIVQTYILTAADGKAEALEALLRRMAAIVRPIAGCEAVAILRDGKIAGRYVFMETYADEADHKASAAQMPQGVLGELTGLLAGKPEVLMLSSALAI